MAGASAEPGTGKLKDVTRQLEVEPILESLTVKLRDFLTARGRMDSPVMIGIRTGGVWIADRLHAALGLDVPPGTLNINFYRDDFSRIGLHPQVEPSDIRAPIDDRHVILVDDVLHTGRTVRAALNEIFDYGRPASVTLAVLVDRGGRELPVCADVCGEVVPLEEEQNVKLYGPEPLTLKLAG